MTEKELTTKEKALQKELVNIIEEGIKNSSEYKKGIEFAEKEFLELVEDIDLELFLTDIKDKEGKKIPQSDELMKLFGIFWEHIKKKIRLKLEEK